MAKSCDGQRKCKAWPLWLECTQINVLWDKHICVQIRSYKETVLTDIAAHKLHAYAKLRLIPDGLQKMVSKSNGGKLNAKNNAYICSQDEDAESYEWLYASLLLIA